MVVGLRSLINFNDGLRYSLVPKFARTYKYTERWGINVAEILVLLFLLLLFNTTKFVLTLNSAIRKNSMSLVSLIPLRLALVVFLLQEATATNYSVFHLLLEPLSSLTMFTLILMNAVDSLRVLTNILLSNFSSLEMNQLLTPMLRLNSISTTQLRNLSGWFSAMPLFVETTTNGITTLMIMMSMLAGLTGATTPQLVSKTSSPMSKLDIWPNPSLMLPPLFSVETLTAPLPKLKLSSILV